MHIAIYFYNTLRESVTLPPAFFSPQKVHFLKNKTSPERVSNPASGVFPPSKTVHFNVFSNQHMYVLSYCVC